MNTKQSPFKAHKGHRTKTIALRASESEIETLNSICKARKEKGSRLHSQADVLFMGMKTVELGKQLFEFRQRLSSNVQSCITGKQMIRDDADKRPRFNGQLDFTPDEAEKMRYLDGCKDAYQRMRNEVDELLASYNQ